MSKLYLVIGDNDEAYVKGVSDYILNNYSHRFQLRSFTKKEYLLNYLSSDERNIDIFLLCQDWYNDSALKNEANNPILLSEGRIINDSDCQSIKKYQRGDKLVSSIIDCFVESNPNNYYTSWGDKKTKVIAVYSPIGGIGKTSIAVGASMKSAEDNKTVFYLNLENIQSTPNFFECQGSKNLSNILYYIRDKKKNIILKIEGIRCIDSQYNVHYFSPPDNSVDLEETRPEDIRYLIDTLKASNNYNRIFIDMSSIIDGKNISILKASDEIILVIGMDDLSITKTNYLIKELEMISKRSEIDLFKKVSIVLNKYSLDKISQIDKLKLKDNSIKVKIPVMSGTPIGFQKNNGTKSIKNEFGYAIDKLLKSINS
ncbi:AAA family ATPase [Maledivibacter halophilus]|uniref:MinD-like ATPase involved in chromosome partitioning or flagellar assembly n=1 Tax=Maledivibacter halophilus TaxID=36842 RepID=A0A1T5IF04_9FIRM|nr:AAA family ATPase [Maledivibacter halophilus]SKC37727.1 MinD-like ATPase involved in chromosome partitioning or flagellar assembly [Maledivibacter halophilus]